MKHAIFIELKRVIRQPSFIFFMIIMPIGIYASLGAFIPEAKIVLPTGANISALMMVQMAFYSAVLAAASVGAETGVFRATGWGRTLSLTPLSPSGFSFFRLIITYASTIVPITLIYLFGAFTFAAMPLKMWVSSYVLCIVLSGVFGTLGQTIGSLIGGSTALGIASGTTVLISFMSDMFNPAQGKMYTLAQYMPFFGAKSLTTWQITDGHGTSGQSLSFAWCTGNFVFWAALLIGVSWWATRFTKSRD
ncbi:hypothetical protein KRX54_01945 [Actinomycetaceae bacterium TAE3-ERU4]|nr:hypothetical protein [Actinomycetaceae bacterium TAE3-ERU4]